MSSADCAFKGSLVSEENILGAFEASACIDDEAVDVRNEIVAQYNAVIENKTNFIIAVLRKKPWTTITLRYSPKFEYIHTAIFQEPVQVQIVAPTRSTAKTHTSSYD